MSVEPKIVCKGVWKIFGPTHKRLSPRGGNPKSAEELISTGSIPAVRDVDLQVGSGETLVIMGLSGSGKSTLLRCMSRLIEPTAGEILFDGANLLLATSKQLIDIRRREMGMVFQNFGLLPHRNVLENVAFPLEVQGIHRADRLGRAAEVIELVGLSGRERHFPAELSGGEQQRVGLARSLASAPKVWFLDEPFSALDPLIRTEMQDEFIRLQGFLHKTSIFVTHDFTEAIRIADRIAIMQDGSIIQIGSPQEVIHNPANEYVAAFTKHAPRHKVLLARDVVATASDPPSTDHWVPASARIEEVARQVLEQEHPVPVRDEDGQVLGVLTRGIVLDIMFGQRDES